MSELQDLIFFQVKKQIQQSNEWNFELNSEINRIVVRCRWLDFAREAKQLVMTTEYQFLIKNLSHIYLKSR